MYDSKTGKPRGYAFIEYETVEDAEKAVSLELNSTFCFDVVVIYTPLTATSRSSGVVVICSTAAVNFTQ